ncbi:MAG: hypothetical protein QOJ60_1094 [Actinomycetota bacterium]|nr:hypothetical protein [Actinomycetota bacterium]
MSRDRTPGAQPSAVGATFEVETGPVAHGGHVVARHEGRVVFVRHALPGERVRVVVTEGHGGSRFFRGDAVEILQAAPGRVDAPCPWAGRCGGCDFQHVALPVQRELKATVVREQLARLAGLEWDVEVEEVPGAPDGLGWRTRVRYTVDDGGRAGLHEHRSHLVVPVDRCRIAHPLVAAADVLDRTWEPGSSVEVVASASTGERLILTDQGPRGAAADRTLVEAAAGRRFRVSGSGFWQVHPGAAGALVTAVIDGLEPRAGESALDLYGGVGLFAAAIAERVGAGGRVTLVEADRGAVSDAVHNLAGLPGVRVEAGRVDRVLRALRLRRADLVVLDPPRAGAGRTVMEQITRIKARCIVYVACDPAALARDLAYAAEHGYRMAALRAFDLFPMTHHVECVATLVSASD